MTIKKTFILCILDGWGYSSLKSPYNAWCLAKTPNFDKLFFHYPWLLLNASGESVGLPENQMGNSEVGHLTIGSGRTILQDLPRINKAIENKSLAKHDLLKKAIFKAKLQNRTIHLISLFSNGGVHSHLNHLNYLCSLLRKENVKFCIHAISDGRDVPPQSFLSFLKNNEYKSNIATIVGRYYAMDRDQRLERTEIAANAIIHSKGESIEWFDFKNNDFEDNIREKNNFFENEDKTDNTEEANTSSKKAKYKTVYNIISQFYDQEKHDEFFTPIVRSDYLGIQSNDIVLTVNFRSDRMKQLMEKLLENLKEENILSMTNYGPTSTNNILFQSINIIQNLGEILEQNNKKQLRLAETEKYPHVTFFLNGGRHIPYKEEDRILIPSSKVATYDLCPEMSAYQVCDTLCNVITERKYDFICVNFANADMVGHTGNIQAAIKACEALDKCIGKITEHVSIHNVLEGKQTELFITADHGNIEEMYDEKSNQPHTFHTCNPVPFLYVNKKWLNNKSYSFNGEIAGSLADIAPTILAKMNIPQPIEMTGKDLFPIHKMKIEID